MNHQIIAKEPTMEEMKRQILEAGGLFYQYRGCKNNASVIYDIENIRHNVIFAQTPLNMNDPFDSFIGYSTEKIYEECIDQILGAFNIDKNIKLIISFILKYKLLGSITEFISSLKELKDYIKSARIAMHMNNIPYDQFLTKMIKKIYGKSPKSVKNFFSKETFVLFGNLITSLDTDNITEETLLSFLQLNSTIDELIEKIESIKNDIYLNCFNDFLSQLTISCFSSSGWNNQLMWAHYANSYSGICIEYDLTKMDDSIGFIYPVNYTNERPTLSLKDFGISITTTDGNIDVVQKEIDIVPIFNYLLCKNTCWGYEKEWRIINIGEKNTPISIDFPFIKSITLGLNIDDDTKRIILDICNAKNIECYELSINLEDFSLDRVLLDCDDSIYDEDLELQSLSLLTEHLKYLEEYINKNEGSTLEKISENNFDSKYAVDILEKIVDMLQDSYRFKITFNKIIQNTEEDISEIKNDENILNMINSINELVVESKNLSNILNDVIKNIRYKYVVPDRDFKLLNQYKNDLKDLSNVVENIKWAITDI